MSSPYSLREGRGRFFLLTALVILLFSGWSVFWYYMANQAQYALEHWYAREAKAGRLYNCGQQRIGGYPFRVEVDCENSIAVFGGEAPLEIKTARILAAWQIYEPTLLIGELYGPLTITELDKGRLTIMGTWSLAQSSLRGRPKAPERASLVFNDASLERAYGESRIPLLRANHIEIHGRLAEDSTIEQPVIETALRLERAALPVLHRATADPMNVDISAVLRGLHDFTPNITLKPWSARLRELQAAGGRIDIKQARVQQGDILAEGNGTISFSDDGHLAGQLQVTVAGLDQFLDKIDAQELVQNSPTINRLAGTLDRLAPGLGKAARERAIANVSTGVTMLGEPAVLEGRRAVKLLLRFKNGLVFLGPIPVGKTPALF